MVKKEDSFYFQAIAEAASGRLDIKVVESSLYQARRAANREEYLLAAKHYQRVFHVWEVLFQCTERAGIVQHKEMIVPALNEYVDVLRQLERQKKTHEVLAAIERLAAI